MEQLYNPSAPPRYTAQDSLQMQSQQPPSFSSSLPPATSWPAIPTSAPQKPANKEDDISAFFNSLITPSPSTVAPASAPTSALPPSYAANRVTPSVFGTTAPPGQSISPIPSAIPSTPSLAQPASASPAPIHSSPASVHIPLPSAAPQSASAPQPAAYSAQVGDIALQLSNFVRKVDDNFDKVTKHLLEIERRLNNLELSSRELTEQQKTVLEKLSQTSQAPQYQPPQQQQTQPPPQYQQQQQPPRPPSYTPPAAGGLSYSTYVPPATSVGMMNLPMKLPQLQPVGGTQPSRPVDQMELDRQLALRLQEEINRAEGGGSTPGGPSDGLLPGVDTKALYSKQSASSSSQQQEECPFCGLGLPMAQLEAHVNKHLDDPNSIPATSGSGKDADRSSILGWLFNRNSGAKPAASNTSAPLSSSPSSSKPPLSAPKPPPQQMMAPQYASIYPGAGASQMYRVPASQLPPGVQIPPGMQLATIPAGAPIPPGAVPLSAVGGMPYASTYPYAQ